MARRSAAGLGNESLLHATQQGDLLDLSGCGNTLDCKIRSGKLVFDCLCLRVQSDTSTASASTRAPPDAGNGRSAHEDPPIVALTELATNSATRKLIAAPPPQAWEARSCTSRCVPGTGGVGVERPVPADDVRRSLSGEAGMWTVATRLAGSIDL